eukprot:CAMPEP_0183713662 /NCGR_PEP_ID=MMETSP0737-20130205/8443_1 /TAXON_ID=385413 /ORGANISM="Thalassiosira miniscula, Strain CCMP1093" /LENGTH=1507 /DNA_ID=CAMNT_0025942481 /DNA_START=178 /DNA_END=4701 /DNA_ORIENTATION=-
MQNPFPRTTATSAASPTSPAQAYDSFIDFEGFPASSSLASPSRSSAVMSSPGVRKFDYTASSSSSSAIMANGGWIGRNGSHARSSVGTSHSHPSSGVVDWPDEHSSESEQPMLVDQRHSSPMVQPSRSRDQQIFRRKVGGTNSTAGISTFSSSRGGGGSVIGGPSGNHHNNEAEQQRTSRGGVLFESYESSSNTNHNSIILDNVSRSRNNMGNRQNHFGSNPTSPISSPVTSNPKTLDVSNNQKSPIRNASPYSSPSSSASKKKTFPSPPPPPTATENPMQSAPSSSAASSPQSVIRKSGGVVNKLVSLFSNKQQSQPSNNKIGGGSPRSKKSNANQKPLGGVQFHVPAKQQQLLQSDPGTSSSPAANDIASPQQQSSSPLSSNLNAPNTPNHAIPAISPSRSNAPSSVTGYSGETGSSYNPTGWPGTVDRRGRTYMMERSYSESEEESMYSSPRRGGSTPRAVGVSPRAMGRNGTPKKYPLQQQHHRAEDLAREFHEMTTTEEQRPQKGFSFDGGSAVAGAAELEDWLAGGGDASMASGSFAFDGDHSHFGEGEVPRSGDGPIDLDSCYNDGNHSQSHDNKDNHKQLHDMRERGSDGPIDLDEAYYQQRGWRRQEEEPLASISETTMTAADRQLEHALGMGNNTNNQFLRQRMPIATSNNPSMNGNASYSTRQECATPTISQSVNGNDARGGASWNRSRTYPNRPAHATATARIDEEAKLKGIDLSGSENRMRALGRQVPSRQQIVYNEEVDFDHGSSHESYNSHSPQRSEEQQQFQQQQQYHYHQQQPQAHSQTAMLTQTLSEETLRWKDRQTAPPRSGGTMMFRGYRGFIDKTKDVPNLMDDVESEASTSLGTGVYSTGMTAGRGQSSSNLGLTLPGGGGGTMDVRRTSVRSRVSSSNVDSGSDVFDGLNSIQEEPFGRMENDILNVNEDVSRQWQQQQPQQHQQMQGNRNLEGFPHSSAQQTFADFEGENLPYSTQFNPFTANRGAPPFNANERSRPPHHFDQGPMAEIADFADPDISAITRGSDTFPHHLDEFEQVEEDDDFDEESFPDLSIYYIEPEMVRKMVRAFRKICTSQMEISSSEDTMLYDFESLVDTKKAFALFEMRSRIMETDIDRGLERRGGTNVVDDIVVTPYFQAAARVRDAVIVSKAWRDGATPKDVVTAHLLTRRSAKAHFVRRPIHRIRRPGRPFFNRGPQYWLEEVTWLDDTDFSLMRCQTLGAGTMKGFEMFTIGDCQSILLRMTSDNCTQLRRELRSAMVRQIEAEELMQEEIDLDGDENIVAEAEQLYREATVEVKSLSIKLVLADKAFTLVRNRMEKLVETIESLLVSIEHCDESDDEHTSSSTRSDEEDYDNESTSSEESRDRSKLIERAKRAELSAEVAVREVLLAKQEVEKIRADKQREIDNLKDELADMETKSQLLASEHHRLAYLDGRKNSYLDRLEAKSFLSTNFENGQEEARKNRLKQKFRERHAQPKESDPLQRINDEETYDFYSRSLKSVSVNK